ncbi:hypothetical protein [Nocardia niwae]|uniref:Uncharacterized protein n=1 Tax=Nocardia niwae TaxID=626084 RepID=A0ABV2XKK7_9NOCA
MAANGAEAMGQAGHDDAIHIVEQGRTHLENLVEQDGEQGYTVHDIAWPAVCDGIDYHRARHDASQRGSLRARRFRLSLYTNFTLAEEKLPLDVHHAHDFRQLCSFRPHLQRHQGSFMEQSASDCAFCTPSGGSSDHCEHATHRPAG